MSSASPIVELWRRTTGSLACLSLAMNMTDSPEVSGLSYVRLRRDRTSAWLGLAAMWHHATHGARPSLASARATGDSFDRAIQSSSNAHFNWWQSVAHIVGSAILVGDTVPRHGCGFCNTGTLFVPEPTVTSIRGKVKGKERERCSPSILLLGERSESL